MAQVDVSVAENPHCFSDNGENANGGCPVSRIFLSLNGECSLEQRRNGMLGVS